MLIACGSDTSKANDAPDVVVKKCVKLLSEGDKEFAKCFYLKPEDEERKSIIEKELKDAVSFKEDIAKKVGIKSIEAKLLSLIEDVVQVESVVIFKNGESSKKHLFL